KAIDLVDEAASRLKMEIDSKPEELDRIDRDLMQMKIEREALKKETDAASKDRLQRLDKSIADFEEQSKSLTQRWEAEKGKLGDAQKVKEELDGLRTELAKAQRQGNLARAGELAYGRIPELEKKLKTLEEGDGKSAVMVEEAVTPDHIAGVVSRWTGVPVDKMLEGEKAKLLRMEEAIAKRVVGQEEAVKAVSTAVRRARAGLQDPNRPIGSFMFLGPTGVGKTELTKALAAFLFDDESAMVRIDMSEYMEKHSVARLIGAPPGYVGYDEGGALTEAVRRRPYQVVLFDEVEKAHPDVFNVLLQVLDDGRLTDGQGRTVDFKNTLIILTSNIGAEYLVAVKDGGDMKQARELVLAEVKTKFRPEFLNRLDEIIVFHRLQRNEMGRIVDIQMQRLQKLLADRKITIELDDAARTWLSNAGYDPAYGARPLKRVIQKSVQDQLAERILAGDIKDGDAVHLGVKDGAIAISAKAAKKAA
ncbi:MAG: AAA family ATPase, partial [Proteobacteria bacterium]|nr:AAA family ATPase [Pseudomonadota bacterium]